MNFPEKPIKQQKSIVWLYVAYFGKKNKFLLIYVPFYRFDQNDLFKQIQNFLRFFPFLNMLRKTNFLGISVLLSEIVTFGIKREVLYEFP